MCFCLVIVLIGVNSNFTTDVYGAEKKGEWKIFATGKIVDVDPMITSNTNEFGIMAHINNNWACVWKSQLKGGLWPGINDTGTLYHYKDKNKTYYKWKKHSIKPKPKPKPKPTPKVVVKKIISDWQNTNTLPKIDKIVVVRFDNDRTSTAYINKYGEWKLDINKDSYKGGKTIINIIEWKDIGI